MANNMQIEEIVRQVLASMNGSAAAPAAAKTEAAAPKAEAQKVETKEETNQK